MERGADSISDSKLTSETSLRESTAEGPLPAISAFPITFSSLLSLSDAVHFLFSQWPTKENRAHEFVYCCKIPFSFHCMYAVGYIFIVTINVY